MADCNPGSEKIILISPSLYIRRRWESPCGTQFILHLPHGTMWNANQSPGELQLSSTETSLPMLPYWVPWNWTRMKRRLKTAWFHLPPLLRMRFSTFINFHITNVDFVLKMWPPTLQHPNRIYWVVCLNPHTVFVVSLKCPNSPLLTTTIVL